jgi:hypothetical protein
MKEIKIIKVGEKQIGIRLAKDIYNKCESLAKEHKCSVQDIIKYILQEEIGNYYYKNK